MRNSEGIGGLYVGSYLLLLLGQSCAADVTDAE